jgi:hypothetical protein
VTFPRYCERCHSELRVRAGGLEQRDGVLYLVQVFYCIEHGDQYKKLVPESGEPIFDTI